MIVSLICRLRFLVMTCVFLAMPGIAPAEADLIGVQSIDILSGWQKPDGHHMAALRIRLKPGWKTYWRAPGDAGIPPQFDWSGSKNIKSVEMMWPRPEVATLGGMRSIVYHNEVIIPLEFTPEAVEKPIEMKAQVTLGVCRDICVPISLQFNVDLSPDETSPDPEIRQALAAQPETAQKAGVGAVTCQIEPIKDGLRVTATIDIPSTGGEETAVLEAPDQSIWVGQAETVRKGGTLIARAEMVPPSNAPFELDSAKVRITVLGSDRAVDIRGCTES